MLVGVLVDVSVGVLVTVAVSVGDGLGVAVSGKGLTGSGINGVWVMVLSTVGGSKLTDIIGFVQPEMKTAMRARLIGMDLTLILPLVFQLQLPDGF